MHISESHLAQEAIAALVDGELPPGPAGRAARHLAGCTSCRMAVEAQREAKAALHGSQEVAVPGDLLSRLCAIPFTADVPPGGGLGGLRAGPDQLVVDGSAGAFSVELAPQEPPDRDGHARWLRRGFTGALAGLGIGVAVLAAGLPGEPQPASGRGPVAGPSAPEERTEAVPPLVRTLDTGSATVSARSGGQP